MTDDMKTVRNMAEDDQSKVMDHLRQANPPELRSILEQDTNTDTDPSPLAEMIEEDAVEDFDPKPPILEE